MGAAIKIKVGESIIVKTPGEVLRLELLEVTENGNNESLAHFRSMRAPIHTSKQPVQEIIKAEFTKDVEAPRVSFTIREGNHTFITPAVDELNHPDSFSVGFDGMMILRKEGLPDWHLYKFDFVAEGNVSIDRDHLARKKERQALGLERCPAWVSKHRKY